MKKKIIVVDDETSMLAVIEAMLVTEDLEVHTFSQAKDAIDYYRENGADLVISDIKMEPVDGITLLKELRLIDPNAVVVLITAYSNVQDALEAMKIGAYDYLQKPFKMEKLRTLVRRGLTMKKILSQGEEESSSDNQVFEGKNFHGMVSKNHVLRGLFDIVKKVAPKETTVLLQGESGTGKELFARAIHKESGRRENSFVAVNCGALPETLLESELFGHEKGAFTGAHRTKEGLFHVAGDGTLFLDEISSLSLILQAKLLRVLQEKEIRPVGGVETQKISCRVVAATNIGLEKLVKEGKFREDLYYRLNVIPIEIPPLRERLDDLMLLIHHFIKKFAGKQPVHIAPPAISFLLEYQWPGNIRELENTIERVVTLCADDRIVGVEDLPPYVTKGSRFLNIIPGREVLPLKTFSVIAEGQYILSVLQKFDGNKVLASKQLGIDVTTINRKLERFEKLQNS